METTCEEFSSAAWQALPSGRRRRKKGSVSCFESQGEGGKEGREV